VDTDIQWPESQSFTEILLAKTIPQSRKWHGLQGKIKDKSKKTEDRRIEKIPV
jgi:hypothetical protein